MLIFGSTALEYWISTGDFRACISAPSDVDVITKVENIAWVQQELNVLSDKYPEMVFSTRVETHWCDAMQYVISNNKHEHFVDLDFLYTIKISHLPWKGKNNKWVQHLKHVDILRKMGAKCDEHLRTLLYEEWENRFGKKGVDFSVTNEEFFTSRVQRKFKHDWLHEELAFHEKPLHESIRKDESSPLCCPLLFEQLTEMGKVLTVFEELYVIAAERFILVGKGKGECAERAEKGGELPVPIAKAKALELLITSLSKGWWNTFAIQYAYDIMTKYPELDEYFTSRIKHIKENY